MFLDFLRRSEPLEERSYAAPPEWLAPYIPEAGLYGSESTALSLPGFWRAVQIKENLISTLPLVAYEGIQRLEQQPLILAQPDPTEDLTVTLSRIVTALILRGNAFALLGSFDDYGYPRSLKVVPNDLVSITDSGDGTYEYRVNGKPVSTDEIMHIRGLTLPGEHYGIGCVETFIRTLSSHQAMNEYAGRFFKDSGTPSAVITNKGEPISVEEARAMKAQWISMQRGTREPVVLNSDIEFKPVTISQEESQFIETKIHSLIEVALMVGIPAYFLGAENNSMTYSNIEQESMNLAKIYLRKELVSIERAFSAITPFGITARFELDDLLRADTKTRYENYNIGLKAGFIHTNEIRETEGLPEMTEVDPESLDPNLLNAMTAWIKQGADPDDVFQMFGFKPIRWSKPLHVQESSNDEA